MTSIEKTFSYTREDILLIIKYNLSSGQLARARLICTGLLTPALFLTVVGGFFFSLVTFVLATFLAFFWIPRLFKLLILRLPAFADPKLYQERSLKITKTHLKEKSAAADTSVAWSYFQSQLVRPEGALLFINQQLIKAVPRRLYSREEWEELLKLITSVVPQQKLLSRWKKMGFYALGLFVGIAIVFLFRV